MEDEHHGPGEVAARLRLVRQEIALAAEAADRDPAAVRLVAVTKTVPADAIDEAINAGQRIFGENRVQEARGKWPVLRERHAGVELHLIGPLQTNKVRDAVALFDVIETLDRPKLARALAEEMTRAEMRPRLFVQVNTGEEEQKAGIAPRAADAFIEDCRRRLSLPIIGLMCIPPMDDEPSPHFALLREIARRHGLSGLSMGMTADFEIAIAFGATHVRVGTAIFGNRVPAAQ